VRVYLAGPIAGYKDANRSAFRRAARYVEARGHTAVNPHNIVPVEHIDTECPPGPPGGEGAEHSAPCYMRADIAELLKCDAIFLLTGWEQSSGAFAEFHVARACGMSIYHEKRRLL
jgi:nucleoside 2-deoxyribosyltransferase